MAKKNQVLCVGHLVYDIRDYVERFPQPDRTTFLTRPPQVSAGGSAANVAWNLRKLGHSSGLISNIGSDRHGEFLLDVLKKEKIEHSQVKKIKGGRTGLSFILINKEGEVMVIEDVGCVDAPRKLPEPYFKNYRWVHITGSRFDWMDQASKYASKHNLAISIDPGRAASRLGVKKLSPILKRAEILFLNRKELEALTGSKAFSKVKELSKKFDLWVVLKTGHGPAVVCQQGRKVFEVPPFNAPHVIDTLGAGDAFASGVIAGRIEGMSLYEAVQFGHACAASKVMHAGAQAMPKRKEVLKRFKF